MDGEQDLTREVIGAALRVHSALGPGLLEAAYRACLAHELKTFGKLVEEEVPLPLVYRGIRLECAYRIDLVVNQCLLVELKSVQQLEPLHTAQLLTYLKLSRKKLGLLINFNVLTLKDGIRRVILTDP